MAQEAWKFVLLSGTFLFLFSLADPRPRGLRNFLGRYAQILKHVIQNAALVIRKYVENVAPIDYPTALRTSTVHRPLKKLGRFRRDLKALPGMLAAHFHPLLDEQFYRARVDRKVPHGRAEEIVF